MRCSRLQVSGGVGIAWVPECQLDSISRFFTACLLSAPSGWSPGPGGCIRCENVPTTESVQLLFQSGLQFGTESAYSGMQPRGWILLQCDDPRCHHMLCTLPPHKHTRNLFGTELALAHGKRYRQSTQSPRTPSPAQTKRTPMLHLTKGTAHLHATAEDGACSKAKAKK